MANGGCFLYKAQFRIPSSNSQFSILRKCEGVHSDLISSVHFEYNQRMKTILRQVGQEVINNTNYLNSNC